MAKECPDPFRFQNALKMAYGRTVSILEYFSHEGGFLSDECNPFSPLQALGTGIGEAILFGIALWSGLKSEMAGDFRRGLF
jgi:hypothetical protein